jgi:oligopeptide transport system substrate-binding protein
MIRFLFALLCLLPIVAYADEAKILSIRLAQEVMDLDWHRRMDLFSARVILNLMEGLTKIDAAGNLKPALAIDWKVSKDGRKYIVNLRPGVVWSDGVPLTAQHFVDGFRRLEDPATAGIGASYWWILKGARDFNSGKTKDAKQLGVHAITPLRLEFDLERPAASFPSLLAHTISLPARLDLISKYGDKWMDPGKLAVLGPYNLSARNSQKIVLTANGHYYGHKPMIQSFQFIVVNDDDTALKLFESGSIDLVYQPPRLHLESLRLRPEFQVIANSRMTVIGFNVDKAPFKDARVRQAFALATDRESIARILDIGRKPGQTAVFEPTLSWIPKGMLGYNSTLGLSFNAELARKKLAEAGFPDGHGFPKVALATDSREDYKLLSERLREIWSKTLNVKVDIEMRDWNGHFGILRTDTPTLFRFGIGTIYNDPDLFTQIFVTGGPGNYTHYANDKYDHIASQASSELKPGRRKNELDQAQKILLEDEPAIIPVLQESLPVLVSKRFKKLEINTQGVPLMSQALKAN